MNYNEYMKSVKLMKSIWPDPNFLPDAFTVDTWYELLKDLPAEQAFAAIKRHAQTSRWPPAIADIRSQAVDMQTSGEDWSDGWDKLQTAIRKYGYYNEQAALDSMDEMTRTVVKRLGWKQICTTDLDDMMALRANFRMIYQEKTQKAKKDAAVSRDLLQNPVGNLLEGVF